MTKFYVGKNSESCGRHSVHRAGCIYLPAPESVLYLGKLASSFSAVAAAKKTYERINGCGHCAPECHLN
jgi:hypothetical protein